MDEGWGELGEGPGAGWGKGGKNGTKIRNHGMSPPEAKKTPRNHPYRSCLPLVSVVTGEKISPRLFIGGIYLYTLEVP